ncbi:putative adhesin/hemolysin precursor [Yersinia similis]|nr:putative adhesin/hemolysin precursor [Yersinia similis]
MLLGYLFGIPSERRLVQEIQVNVAYRGFLSMDLRVQGAEMLAGKDINLTGKNVSILAAENQLTQIHTVEQKQSGLTLALSGAVGSAVNTAVTTAKAASEESSGRLGALQGVKAALNGVQAVQAEGGIPPACSASVRPWAHKNRPRSNIRNRPT